MYFGKDAMKTLMDETRTYASSIGKIKECLFVMGATDNDMRREEAYAQFLKLDQSIGGATSLLISTDRIKSQFMDNVRHMSQVPGRLEVLIDYLETQDLDDKSREFLVSIRQRAARAQAVTEGQASYLANLFFMTMN